MEGGCMKIRCENLRDAAQALWEAYQQLYHYEEQTHSKQDCVCRCCTAARLARQSWELVAEEYRQRGLSK